MHDKKRRDMEKPIFSLTNFENGLIEVIYLLTVTVNIRFYDKYICETSQLVGLVCL